MKIRLFLHLLFILVCVLSERLGLQSGLQSNVEHVQGFLPAEQFFNDYVFPGKPVIFKNAAKEFPAFNKWTDEYLASLPESSVHAFLMEYGKKENRDDPSEDVTMNKFLNVYKKDDVYLINGIPKYLTKDIPVYDPLDCDFVVRNFLSDIVMWFSSGGTTSVWHWDSYENINCLLRGSKELIMMDKKDYENGHLTNRAGSFSAVDVDNVDTAEFPNFKNVTFYNATIHAGDCLYIPWRWFHYVKSFGSNLAVNVWFDTYRTPFTCKKTSFKSFADATFRKDSSDLSKGEPGEYDFMKGLHQAIYNTDHMNLADSIDNKQFIDIFEGFQADMDSEYGTDTMAEIFAILDENKDGHLNLREIDSLITTNYYTVYYILSKSFISVGLLILVFIVTLVLLWYRRQRKNKAVTKAVDDNQKKAN